MFGEDGGVPSCVVDMFFPTRGCDMIVLTSVLGVYSEGYRRRGEYLSARVYFVDTAYSLLGTITEYTKGEGVAKLDEVKEAEEDRMFELIRTGDNAALVSLLQMYREQRKGGYEERLKLKILHYALCLVRGLSDTMVDMWQKDVQPSLLKWPLPPTSVTTLALSASTLASSSTSSGGVVVRPVRRSKEATSRVVKSALVRYVHKTQDTKEAELNEAQEVNDLLKTPLGAAIKAFAEEMMRK